MNAQDVNPNPTVTSPYYREGMPIAAAAVDEPTDRVTLAKLHRRIRSKAFYRLTDVLIICVVTLDNGFTVTGQSACVNPENYNEPMGRKIAEENAVEQLWVLEGYLLQERRFLATMGEYPEHKLPPGAID